MHVLTSDCIHIRHCHTHHHGHRNNPAVCRLKGCILMCNFNGFQKYVLAKCFIPMISNLVLETNNKHQLLEGRGPPQVRTLGGNCSLASPYSSLPLCGPWQTVQYYNSIWFTKSQLQPRRIKEGKSLIDHRVTCNHLYKPSTEAWLENCTAMTSLHMNQPDQMQLHSSHKCNQAEGNKKETRRKQNPS